jgi:Cft2 family RNA processing exonuclease
MLSFLNQHQSNRARQKSPNLVKVDVLLERVPVQGIQVLVQVFQLGKGQDLAKFVDLGHVTNTTLLELTNDTEIAQLKRRQ